MTAFVKLFRQANHVRRFSIESTRDGWSVRKEEDDRVLQEARYNDWHRVERARRAFVIEMATLQKQGWRED